MSKVNYKQLVSRIPHKVQLKNKVFYDVLYQDKILFAKDAKEACGITIFQNRQIVIAKGLSDKLTIETYLHELAHAFSFEYSLNLTENQILAMEKGFYYLLKADNIFSPTQG